MLAALPPGTRLAGALFAAVGLGPSIAVAGPPFVTDDPAPTEEGHWEIYGFVTGVHARRETTGSAGFDVNYGVAKDLQVSAVFPLNYRHSSKLQAGLGGVELSVKHLAVHQAATNALPDVAISPYVILPTADDEFGSGRVKLFLPLWAQRDFGKVAIFGGGGYQVNPGRGQRNFWKAGVGMNITVDRRLSVGGEVYHQSPDTADARSFTGVNFGASYRLSDRWSVLASTGPGIQHARALGRYGFYMGLKWER
jgi:hypothetical protein